MERRNWYLLLGALMVALSAVLYAVHFAIFHDPHHIFIYMLGDLAFLPLEVLFVTLIIHKLLSDRDKRMTMEKMNMVIGAFYSEIGTELLRRLRDFDGRSEDKRRVLAAAGELTEGNFPQLVEALSKLEFSVESFPGDLQGLRALVVGKRDFMVRLLENPILLEHESFTNLLWAVFHLTEELASRGDLAVLPEPDLEHLSGDMSRAYGSLGMEWLNYMVHLEQNYPYLFSLAVRLNPFDPGATVEISG